MLLNMCSFSGAETLLVIYHVVPNADRHASSKGVQKYIPRINEGMDEDYELVLRGFGLVRVVSRASVWI